SNAFAITRMLDFAAETLLRVCASRRFGRATAARMAMIATTIMSSISVKAFNRRVELPIIILSCRHSCQSDVDVQMEDTYESYCHGSSPATRAPIAVQCCR